MEVGSRDLANSPLEGQIIALIEKLERIYGVSPRTQNELGSRMAFDVQRRRFTAMRHEARNAILAAFFPTGGRDV